ncbi:hypothetical protein EWM64_g10250 [Hericium alpestre]|uniref:Uncharacterized protein n=1 Tax=Hericium alpestre TaxID=135208 RepID=A0A4Y9ZIR6_9AGAM|nr:hypothetical protein EWM64_g10250 [Hericium alpestre]
MPWTLVFHPVSYGHPDVLLCYPAVKRLQPGFHEGPLYSTDIFPFHGVVHIGTVRISIEHLVGFLSRNAANLCRNCPSLPNKVQKIDTLRTGTWAMRLLDAFEVAGAFTCPISNSDEFFSAIQIAVSNLPSKPFKKESGNGVPVIDLAGALQHRLHRVPLVQWSGHK